MTGNASLPSGMGEMIVLKNGPPDGGLRWGGEGTRGETNKSDCSLHLFSGTESVRDHDWEIPPEETEPNERLRLSSGKG